MTRLLRFAPLILLALVLAGLVWRIAVPAETAVRSKLVGQPLPALTLAPFEPDGTGIALRSIEGRPHLVNFFASWCVPCIAEIPLLMEMKRQGVPILGIAVRDRPEDVAAFLTRHGNPYAAIGADPESESEYGCTKGRGEEAVRKAFYRATIIRPSLVFGPEDQLTNRFAAMASTAGSLPVVAATRRFQPVYVRDLAQAIAAAALDPAAHAGKTYEIGGPEVMTFRDLNEQVVRAAGLDADVVELPDIAGSIMSRFGWLPGAPLTRDQWLMLKRDNVASEDAPGLAALGVEATAVETIIPSYLDRFRKGGWYIAHGMEQPR